MRKLLKIRPNSWANVIALGVLCGLVVVAVLSRRGRFEQPLPGEDDGSPVQEGMKEPAAPVADDVGATAMAYAQAMQRNQGEEVVRMTLWIQDRLSRLRLNGADEAALQEESAKLARRTQDRRIEGNQLSSEGLEDRYIFAPGARLELLGVDAGRTDLAQPSKGRAWLRVTYPMKTTAPRGSRELPIRSIIVGVNVSKQGLVLKAGIVGNLEIDLDSISYEWEDS